jgi:cell division protein DivIC
MKFLKIFKQKKFTLVTIFLLIYLLLNLIDGERGLISFYKNQKIKEQLIKEKEKVTNEIASIEKKNNLLTDNVDLDFLETLYREKFMVGKSNELIFTK